MKRRRKRIVRWLEETLTTSWLGVRMTVDEYEANATGTHFTVHCIPNQRLRREAWGYRLSDYLSSRDNEQQQLAMSSFLCPCTLPCLAFPWRAHTANDCIDETHNLITALF
ncbi:MAG: hypothetical protein FRX48_04208 [Lasallia pustulata]|uniref:Uncharacterized protein n=1 Tax=Lasallia pustulata TaxID=136370 RepID=A0A5M8PSY2_9LECA|nr:MAG: hypothetical protein FRX48_04208 [Lasallia pustulata]